MVIKNQYYWESEFVKALWQHMMRPLKKLISFLVILLLVINLKDIIRDAGMIYFDRCSLQFYL